MTPNPDFWSPAQQWKTIGWTVWILMILGGAGIALIKFVKWAWYL